MEIRRWQPAEGSLTVALLLLIGVTLAWSLDDAAWVLGRSDLTDFLPWAILGGIGYGIVAAKSGWARWPGHFGGAVLAALVVPALVGTELRPGGSPIEWYQATAASSVNAYFDLAVNGRQLTTEFGHFLLVLGLLAWSIGQFAGYATFGHRRPLSAVLIVGLALLTNMSLTEKDHLAALVVFSVAALFLLSRFHAFDEQAAWMRRRIGDPKSVAALHIRGGAAFISLAVVASLFLTTSASSAPLRGAWSGAEDLLLQVGQGLQRYFSFVQSVRGPAGVIFGSAAPITGRWVTDDSIAATIQVPRGDETPYYWRAAAYDQFDLGGWSWSPGLVSQVPRAESELLFGALGDAPLEEGHVEVVFTVAPEAFRASTLLSPNTPVSVDRPSRITAIGRTGRFVTIDGVGSTRPYTVTASLPTFGEEPGQITQNKLRVAGTEYPTDVMSLYGPRKVPVGALGPATEALAEQIKAQAPDQNPFDLADTTVRVLHSAAFEYDADVTDIDCGPRSRVECFAQFRKGYCQHYASTMAILMRHFGVPARLVQGFLPGERDERTGLETVRFSDSHAWVEVYFPGYGWVDFDPTGGNLAQQQPIPVGQPRPTPSSRPTGSPGDEGPAGPLINPDLGEDRFDNGGSGGTSGSGSTDNRGFVAIAFLLVLAILGLAFIAYERGPRGVTEPEAAYRGIAGLARRLGFGPKPTQTVFEYTHALGELVPVARPDLSVVANAKVQVAYGRRTIGGDGLRRLREAHRRLRVSLLRLALRRGIRRRRRS